MSPRPAPARAPLPLPGWHRGRADGSPLLPWAEPAGPASEGFSCPLSQRLKGQLNKTQPDSYSKHLLVFKENNSVKGTELCLKPYAFSFFLIFFYKLIWLQILHEIKRVCFSPRDLELRTVCLFFFSPLLFFPFSSAL